MFFGETLAMLSHIHDSGMFDNRQSFNFGLNLSLKLVNFAVNFHSKFGARTAFSYSNSATSTASDSLSNRKLVENLALLLTFIGLVI